MATILGDRNPDNLNDDLRGGPDPDVIAGFSANDYLFGGDGADTLNGGAGDDTLEGGVGDDRMIGEAGRDTFRIGGDFNGNDVIWGGDGDDYVAIVSPIRVNRLILDAVASVETLGAGLQNVRGTSSGDLFDLSGVKFFDFVGDMDLREGADTFIGGVVGERVFGGDGDDSLDGGEGADLLDGGTGDDTLVGGLGGDVFNIGGDFNGNDMISGGDGDDYVAIVSPIRVNRLVLDAAASVETLGAGLQNVRGTSSGDLFDLSGVKFFDFVGDMDLREGADTFIGGVVGERIFGGDGDDSLDGGAGADLLDGGTGDDTLVGGLGGDVFNIGGDFNGNDMISGGDGDDYVAIVSPIRVNRLVLDAAASVETLGGNGVRGTSSGDLFDLSGVKFFDFVGDMDLREGADTFIGGVVGERVFGGDGDDSLDGGDGADLLVGGRGNDRLTGGDDGDRIELGGNVGFDTISGGDGDDVVAIVAPVTIRALTLNAKSDVETLDFGGQVLRGSGDADAVNLSGVSRFDNGNVAQLRGGADSFTGSNLAEFVDGGEGADTLLGSGGADTLVGGGGADSLVGGTGADTFELDGETGVDVFSGGAGRDVVRLTGAVSTERFTLRTTDSVETLDLSDFALRGTTGADEFDVSGVRSILGLRSGVLLRSGDDAYEGSLGSDVVDGGAGNDTLDGGAGVDTLVGGTGDDIYFVDRVDDRIVERRAEGVDSVTSSAESFELGGHIENLTLTGRAAIEGIGNALANTIVGTGLNNRLAGGEGLDTLTGGAGSDTFVFDTRLGSSNIDRITDFSVPRDTIELDNAIFRTIRTEGSLSDEAFVIGSSAAERDDRIIYDRTTGALFYDRDGSGASGQIQFATLRTGLNLTADDFTVV